MIKIVKIVIDILFTIIIVILGIYGILRFTNKIEIYRVETGSMEDGIHIGDYILIHKNTKYNVGDVVTFKKYNSFVTHRIVEKKGDNIITKGDANNVEDEEISIDDIVGKVIYKGGMLNFVVDYKYAIASFMLSMYLLTFYFDRKKEEKKEKNEENEDNLKEAMVC